jgi:autotransporter-associated beta strand protein
LEKVGTGILKMGGTNSYTGTTTVNAGTLQIGNGGASGSLGAGAVTVNTALSFNRTNALTLTNAIGGGGNVYQSGSGVTTLSGANTYTGTTTVSAGKLVVNGTHTGGDNYTIGANGSIGGSGVITLAAAKTFTLSGNVSPGNSTGNLTVTAPGNDSTTVFAGGGSFTMEINANADHGGSAGGATGWDKFTVDSVSVTAGGGNRFTIQVVGVGITNGTNWEPNNAFQRFPIVDHNGIGAGFTAADIDKFDLIVSGFDADENLGGFYLDASGSGDLELVYVPEPTSLVTVGLIASSAPLRRRRRAS